MARSEARRVDRTWEDGLAEVLAGLSTLRRKEGLSVEDTEVYARVLADVPLPVLQAAGTRILREGNGWFPTPPELRQACAHERARILVANPYDGCESCAGQIGWVDVQTDRGPAVKPCLCKQVYANKLARLGVGPEVEPRRLTAANKG